MLFKKLLSFIYAIIMMLTCTPGKLAVSLPVTVEGAIFGGGSDAIQLTLDFDGRWITTASNVKYNSRLAQASAILADDVYFRAKDLAKGTQNRVLVGEEADAYTQAAMLEALGYTDVRFIESFKAMTYEYDSNDSVTMLIGYKNIEDKYDSYITIIRGCFSIGEWCSIYDSGSTCENYELLTGVHPEWTNKNNLKGLDVAANRAKKFIDDYMAEHDDPKRLDTLLLTGHSRGGCISDILGAGYEKDASVKSYTYTFNTAPVTTAKDAAKYKTIFNVLDKNDFYSAPMPFGEEKLSRYGRDIYSDDSIISEIAALKGRDDYTCVPKETKAEFDALFGKRFPDRKSVYEMRSVTETFDTLAEAEARYAECETLIGAAAGIDISAFCKLGEMTLNADGKYEFTMDYCSAALLTGYAKIQAYGTAYFTALKTLFKEDADGIKIAELINDNLLGIKGAHLLVNTYVAAGKSLNGLC